MFSRVLIANRGEIACRIIATCRRLGIRCIAVYSDADVDSPHVKAADEAIYLGPAPATESYLNSSALLRALNESRADALHPGYGFLSESAIFAAAVAQSGRVFVGPSAHALALLSDKIRARERATQLGLLPVPGMSHSVDGANPLGWLKRAEPLGWPLLVKAAAGGGGIGMQRVANASELSAALQRATGAAQRAFGDGRIYLERYVERPRHVELQLIRGANGTVTTLGTRECSVQRRFQKFIEECPSPTFQALPPARQAHVEALARSLLASVDYVGVATLELLVDNDANVYFLEVNARLQVEHTVTEQVFGVDLVEEQLRIAAADDVTASLKQAAARGHAIEARIYAESPARGFIPQPGRVETLQFPQSECIRVDCGISVGSQMSPHYDPLIAKVIAWSPHRSAATRALHNALSETQIVVMGKRGRRDNNIQLLRQVLESSEWSSANYDTHLVERLLTPIHSRSASGQGVTSAPMVG